ncbi:oxidoreductase [Alteribacillus sp. JSM 102045]|uniref:oxidoreductase n=1 Tax=Alteribacillus sp. JSM 102045 TaxID=1562101 RepID=UPI0035C2299F
MSYVRAGLIGFGFSGATFHAPVIDTVKNIEITHVASSNPEKVRNHLPNAEVFNNAEDVCRHSEIDAVIITTPNTTHYPFAKEALEHQKHVVLEKPFVPRLQEAEELISIAEKKGLLLSVYHNRRWDNDFLTLKDCMEKGELGSVHTYEAVWNRYRPEVRDRWREQNLPGSGNWHDLGSHLVDQALVLFGEPDTIFGDIQVQRKGGKIADYFHVILGYPNRRVILRSGSMAIGDSPRYIVHGTKGSFVKYGLDSQESMLKNGGKPGDQGWGEDSKDNQAILTNESENKNIPSVKGAYEQYYIKFRDAVLEGYSSPVTAHEAARVIKVLELAEKSSQNQTVVSFH